MNSKQKLTFGSIILLTINSIIGSGIFLSPGSVVLKAGSKAPLVYLVAAVLAALLAITFASAAKYVDRNGAAYAYAKAAFGDRVGLYVGATRFIVVCIAWGVMATAAVKTVLSIYGFDSSDFRLVTIGFVILMAILVIINLIGIRFFAIINDISTIGKVVALMTAIIAGFVIFCMTGQSHMNDVMSVTQANGQPLVPTMTVTTFVTATLAAFYAFTGFEAVATGSQDMEKPERNLPRAIPIGILIVALVYFGVVLVAMLVNSSALVETKDVVVLAAVFTNPIIRNVILYGALLSMLGINVAASFNSPRVLEALAQENQVPRVFARRTKNGCPSVALLTTAVLAVVLPMAFQYNMNNIMVLSSISRFIEFIVVPLAVIVFFYGRQKERTIENAPRNFVTDVIIPALAFIFAVFLVVKFDWHGEFSIANADGTTSANIVGIIAMLLGYVALPIALYIWGRHRKPVEA